MSGGGKTQTTTSRVEIPDNVKPMLDAYLQRSFGLSGGSPVMQGGNQAPPQPAQASPPPANMLGVDRGEFGGIYRQPQQPQQPAQATAPMMQQQAGTPDGSIPLAPISQQQQLGAQMGQQAGLMGMYDTDTARQTLGSTARGDYLSGNPYLQSQIDASMGDITQAYQRGVAPQTDAQFARAGAFGGSAWRQAQEAGQQQLGRQLGRTASQMRYGDYGQERSRQLQAAQQLPDLSRGMIGQAAGLFGLGGQMQAAQQQQYDKPLRDLGILGQAVQTGMGAAGQTQTAPNPNYQSPLQQAAAFLPFLI